MIKKSLIQRVKKLMSRKDKMPYKYTTSFESEIFAHQINDEFISEASLSELSSLVPKDIDFEKNVDLLGVSFNAAVVNVFNRNGDGIDSSTALKYNDQFIHKPTNIEHNKDKIVGHIVTAGFSEYGSNKILSNDKIENKKDPFNIALGAVVYRSANKSFAELIEKSTDPEDKSYYKKISASWEVGFSNYVLAVGSDKLSEATIVEDPREIKKLNGCLKAYGGSGKTEKGEPVYRLITGKIYPLGIGFTSNPAADVKGIYKDQEENAESIKDDSEDKISQKIKKTVTKEKNIAMENIVNELKELLVEKKIGEEAVASMTQSFSEAIRQKNEEFLKEKEALLSEQEAAKKEYEDLKASVAELESKLAESNDRINVFENEKKAEEAVARFNTRMDELDSKFELADEDREFLAKEVKSIEETEEAFASFSDKLEVLWKHKSKENKEAFEAEIQARIDEEVAKRIAKASEEVDVEEALDNAKQVDADLSNNNEAIASKEENLVDKFKKAFSRENIEIS